MDLRGLIDRARAETQDLSDPPLWSDDEWRDYFNEAADEAAIRAKLIEDDSIEVDVSAGEAYAEYPEYVWSIQGVKLGGKRMTLLDKAMLDATEGEDWESRTGTPWACYEVGGRLRFFPVPEVAGTASITAFCTPKAPMVNDTDQPGLRQRLHSQLIDWALHLAYLKKDADTFDAGLSAQHGNEFEKTFGPRPDEVEMRRRRINVRRYVAGNYF